MSKKLPSKALVILGAAAAIVVAAAINVVSIQSNAAKGPSPEIPQYPKVTVVDVSPGVYQVAVTGYGEVAPVHQLSLSAEVSGQVTKISPKLRSGLLFERGEVLLEVEDIPYQQALASAKSALSAAQLALMEEELNRKQAQEEWQRSGLSGEPDSVLVLHEPQLKVAQDNVMSAKQMLFKSQMDLAKTRIKAPFDALVVSRLVEPGSYLQPGSEIVELYGVRQFELSISLSEQQWRNLPTVKSMTTTSWPVTLVNIDETQQWQGIVTRAEQHVDSSNSQRSLIITVNEPLLGDSPIYPGTFVQVNIPGKQMAGLWKLPASAISKSGRVWYVADDHTLQSARATIRFSNADLVFVEPVTGTSGARIVSRPLSSYLVGMKVLSDTAVLIEEMGGIGERKTKQAPDNQGLVVSADVEIVK